MGTTQSTQTEQANASTPITIDKNTTDAVAGYGKIIVNEYIKQIQIELPQSIPTVIIELCIDFYCSSIILIYLDQGNHHEEPFQLCITDFNEKRRKFTANIRPHVSPNTKHEEQKQEKTLVNNASIYFAKNVHLPHAMSTELQCNPRTQFDVMFRYGGIKSNVTRSCNALIWRSNVRRHGNRVSNIEITDYRLPEGRYNNAKVVYSERYHSLYGIASGSPCVSRLDLAEPELAWKDVTTRNAENGVTFRSEASCVLMDSNGEETILCLECDSTPFYVKQFRLSDHKTSVHPAESRICARWKHGALYDKYSGRVFVGGGHPSGVSPIVTAEQTGHSVGYLDSQKMKWFDGNIPATLMKHDHFPILWKDGELLYIASVKGNGIEWIDLRAHNKTWNMYSETLNAYFDTEIHGYNAYRCRLLR